MTMPERTGPEADTDADRVAELDPVRRIIVTKVRPPRRRKDMVSRSRLVDYVSANVDRKLILVSAPPGYGKTTLLVDFLHATGFPACWYRLDEADNDLAVFFEHLIASLRQRYPGVCTRTERLLRSETRPDPEALVGSLINEISEEIDEFFVLVLDDYHMMDESVLVNAALDFFLRYLPENVRLVVSTRTLPKKLTLTRLAAEGAVIGVGQDHLRFRPDEIRDLVRHLHADDLSIAEAQALADRSEGWIAALVLGSARLLDGVRTGLSDPVSNRGTLYEYLAREVIDQQPEDVVRFLIDTSILDAFSPSLCDAVRETDDSAAMLERLEASNVFIQRVESEDTWYRYHQLFQDFLRTLAAQESPAEQLAARHARAAEWFAEHGPVDMEINHLLAAGDMAAAADRISEAIDYGHRTGRWRTMIKWISGLPIEELRRRPRLLQSLGTAYAYRGELPQSLQTLNEAVRAFEKHDNPDLLADVLISRSYTWRYMGQVDASVADATRALDLATDPNGHLAGKAHRAMGACLSLRGDMREAAVSLQRALEAFAASNDPLSSALTHSDLSAFYQLTGNVDSSLYHASEAQRYWAEIGNLPNLALALNNLGTGYHAEGRFEEALEHLSEATRTAYRSGDRRTLALALVSMADVEADLDRFRDAARHYQEGLEIARNMGEGTLVCYSLAMMADIKRLEGNLPQAQELLHSAREELAQHRSASESALVDYVRGTIALDRGELSQAAEHLEDAARAYASMGALRELARTHLYRCAAYHRSGALPSADRAWRQAVEAANKFGYKETLRPQARRLPDVFARDKIRLADSDTTVQLFGGDEAGAAERRDAESTSGGPEDVGTALKRGEPQPSGRREAPAVSAASADDVAGEAKDGPSGAGEEPTATPAAAEDTARRADEAPPSAGAPPSGAGDTPSSAASAAPSAAAGSESSESEAERATGKDRDRKAPQNGREAIEDLTDRAADREADLGTAQDSARRPDAERAATDNGGQLRDAPPRSRASEEAADETPITDHDANASEGAEDEPSSGTQPWTAEHPASPTHRPEPEPEPEPETEPAPSLSVRAFGAPEVLVEGEPVDVRAWETTTARDLFLFLLDRAEGASRDEVMLAFWPESNLPRATSAFHSTLHRVRRVLGKQIVKHERDRYRVNAPADLMYDVAEFEDLVFQASVAETDADAIELLARATSLVTGEYLEGVSTDWSRDRADDLLEASIDSHLALAERLTGLGRHADAARAYKAAIELDPLREDIHRRLMRSLAESGDRVKALRHYERLVEILDEELGIEPDDTTLALHAAIRDREPSSA